MGGCGGAAEIPNDIVWPDLGLVSAGEATGAPSDGKGAG